MKTKSRIHAGYKEGTPDWEAEYNMLLPDGVTCAECYHCDRCVAIFGQQATDTKCQFHPNKFYPKATAEETISVIMARAEKLKDVGNQSMKALGHQLVKLSDQLKVIAQEMEQITNFFVCATEERKDTGALFSAKETVVYKGKNVQVLEAQKNSDEPGYSYWVLVDGRPLYVPEEKLSPIPF